MKRYMTGLMLTLLVLISASDALAENAKKGGVWAASDGKGNISIFWASGWPSGGWRLERISGGKPALLRDRIMPAGDEERLRGLDLSSAEGLKDFAGKLKSNRLTKDERSLASVVLIGRAMSDDLFGRALGIRHTDTVQGSSEVSYRVTLLDGSGKPGEVLQSPPVHPAVMTPLPESVSGLSAKTAGQNVSLTWSKTPMNRIAPVIGYHIERATEGASLPLTPVPLIVMGLKSEGNAIIPSFEDRYPPVETELSYFVFSVDLFGRKSLSARVKVFVPDETALTPPATVVAQGSGGGADITWKSGGSNYTAGYIVERSMLYDGPYENLTPKGLKRDVNKYRDSGLTGGAAYYYRVRAVGPRGEVGHPSHAAMAQPMNEGPPPAPAGLKAEIGRTRIRLTWEPVKFPVAGYFVYRKAAGTEKWYQLNDRAMPEPLLDLPFSEQNGERYIFRVIAVGFDSQESKPGGEIEVLLPDNLPPNTPHIRAVSGAGGRAEIQFVPSEPEADTSRFLILRSGSEYEEGFVIGDPLPSNARNYTDYFVEPGQLYWYRVVALDKAGNRSDLGRPAAVLIGTPEIPVPKKPDLKIVEKPFRHVLINLDPPPFGLSVIIQVRRESEENWRRLTGPVSDLKEAIDAGLPDKGRLEYRVVYQAANGIAGEPSGIAGIILQ